MTCEQVSTLCGTTMHTLVKEELEQFNSEEEGNDVVEKKWRELMKRSFERMDELATSSCVCGTTVSLCSCDPREAAISGSTAVAAVLTQEHIIVANTGDSRAVLCRSGVAIPLSNDHKVLYLIRILVRSQSNSSSILLCLSSC